MDHSTANSTSHPGYPNITKDDPFSVAWDNIGKIAQQLTDLEQKRGDTIHGHPKPPKIIEPSPQAFEAHERKRREHDISRSFEDDADFFPESSLSSRRKHDTSRSFEDDAEFLNESSLSLRATHNAGRSFEDDADFFSNEITPSMRATRRKHDISRSFEDDADFFPESSLSFRREHDAGRSFEDDADFFRNEVTTPSSRTTSDTYSGVSTTPPSSSQSSPSQDKSPDGDKMFHGTIDYNPNSRCDPGCWKLIKGPKTKVSYWQHRETGVRLVYEPKSTPKQEQKLSPEAAGFKMSYAGVIKGC